MDTELDWITHQALEALTGAHRTTVARWKRLARSGRVARWLRVLVATVHRGQLDALHAAWRGWMINSQDGTLVSPEGVTVTQGQIRALPQLYALRDALQAELRGLRAAERAPLPAPAPIRPPPPSHRITRTSSAPSSAPSSTAATGCRRGRSRVAVT